MDEYFARERRAGAHRDAVPLGLNQALVREPGKYRAWGLRGSSDRFRTMTFQKLLTYILIDFH